MRSRVDIIWRTPSLQGFESVWKQILNWKFKTKQIYSVSFLQPYWGYVGTYSHYAICISIIAASFNLSSVVWLRMHWMHSLTFMTLWFHKLCHGVKICWFKDLQNLVLLKDINEKRFTYIAWWIAATLFRQKVHSFWVELEGFLTQIKLLDCEHYQWITLTWVRIRLKVEREAEV